MQAFESELFPEIFTRDSNEEDRTLFLDAAGQPLPEQCWDPDLNGSGRRSSDGGEGGGAQPASKARCCW